jgi:protein-tyrosine phosphatase
VSARFRWLFVCTGNICRSPMAERLTVAGLGQRLGAEAGRFDVRSAGTYGLVGRPVEPYAAEVLAAYGVDAAGFEARRLVSEAVEGADLVLAATRDHRAAAVILHPGAAIRCFTMREFARLVGDVDPAELPTGDAVRRARALVTAAAGRRGQLAPVPAADDDLADPYGSRRPVYRETGAQIVEALRPVLDAIAGASPDPPYSDSDTADDGSSG